MKTIEDLKTNGVEIDTIYCADCLEAMKLIPDKSIDMILADLPYGTTACKWDTIIPFEPLRRMKFGSNVWNAEKDLTHKFQPELFEEV